MSDPQPKRPRDLISAIEAIAAQNGDIAAVDEYYYRDFMALDPEAFRRLVILVLLSHQKEVLRISCGKGDNASCDRVADFVSRALFPISQGLMRCDAFGRLHFTSRIGPDADSLGLSGELDDFLQKKRGDILATVRATLPWHLKHLEWQGELPL
jgi:hypothetical protein